MDGSFSRSIESRFKIILHNLFLDVTSYWRIEIGQIAPNGIWVIVSFILMCKSFGVPTSLELFSKFFDIKPARDGSGWHTFQRKSGVVELMKKLPQSNPRMEEIFIGLVLKDLGIG